MDEQLRNAILEAKSTYETEGFVILGIFGSRARGDFGPKSDIDILYRLTDAFHDKYPGWDTASRIMDIKNDLAVRIGLPVDVANIDALGKVARKYILPETVYVA